MIPILNPSILRIECTKISALNVQKLHSTPLPSNPQRETP
ncbi:hypothetical protein BIFBRE_03031 [Bifidobacterium breve DSM 20213 = JCM 1192]|uniref:Uncharacterized protein n=1 Tax=Bifidobacterium breve DSM 20213 = JCM 1192 TaxID=518634 RepID=D4BLU4_BIFBR|nr:hypothetical protein BIFBRE_03031 [Bifidobacterium breve DSM 20213 = JCM 1192]